MKIYLDGTGLKTEWKEVFNIANKNKEFELYENDEVQKDKCDYLVYIVTPKLKGVGVIVNAVNDSNKQKGKTIFIVQKEDGDKNFTTHQEKSLVATGKMIEINGGKWFTCFDNAIDYMLKN